nr:hypothetical protein [Trichoderma harzianum]
MSSEYPYPRPHRLDLDDIKISITHESYTIALQTVDYYHRQAITMTPDEQEKYVEMVRSSTLDQNYAANKNTSGWEQPDDPEDTPNKRKDKEDDNRRPKKLKVTTSRFRLPDDDYGEDPSPTCGLGIGTPDRKRATLSSTRNNHQPGKTDCPTGGEERQTGPSNRTTPSNNKLWKYLKDPVNAYCRAHFVMLAAAYGISKLSHLRENVEGAGDVSEIMDYSKHYDHSYHHSTPSPTEDGPASAVAAPAHGSTLVDETPSTGATPINQPMTPPPNEPQFAPAAPPLTARQACDPFLSSW